MRPRSRAPQSSTAVTRPRSRATPIQPYCQLTQPLTGRQAHYTRRERQCVHGIAPNNPSPYGVDAGHTENIRRNCSPTTINESPMKTAFSHARKLNSYDSHNQAQGGTKAGCSRTATTWTGYADCTPPAGNPPGVVILLERTANTPVAENAEGAWP